MRQQQHKTEEVNALQRLHPPAGGRAVLKLFHFLTFASLSLRESRAKGPERVAALLVVESMAGSEDPPRPLRGRPSRTRSLYYISPLGKFFFDPGPKAFQALDRS